MIKIPVCVMGDHWINEQQVLGEISQLSAAETLVLDLQAEGPSLHRIGLVQSIMQQCELTHRDPASVWIDNWSNAVEPIPFRHANLFLLSHFFWLSDRYQVKLPPPQPDAKMFGFFIGRRTMARMSMLQDLYTEMPDRCLFSVMYSRGDLPWLAQGRQCETGWVDPNTQKQFERWCREVNIGSLDNAWIHEQYQDQRNTNRDLLANYHKFRIELVAETFTLGQCFFPTEKTVRPLRAGKPMFVYGPIGYLGNLRALGFRTWQDLWDEDYDNLEGPQRWQVMRRIMQNVTAADLAGSDKIAAHNQEVALELIRRYRPG